MSFICFAFARAELSNATREFGGRPLCPALSHSLNLQRVLMEQSM
jgi:hypothetical protein